MPEELFRNDQPLVVPGLRAHGLALDRFPTVQDFRVEARDCGGDMGWHIDFWSDSFGALAGFPWWDDVDVRFRQLGLKSIHLGTLDEPYVDVDQTWQIVIFEDDGFVYVRQNSGIEDEEDPSGETFPIWFRVPRDRYLREWTKVIRQFNPGSSPEAPA